MAGGIKRLAKETAVYGLSSIIGRFLNWLLIPMYVRVLADPGEYGIVSNLYGWSALLLVLLTYGMETGFFRFMNKEEENPAQVYASTLFSLSITSLFFFIAAYAFQNPVSVLLGYVETPEYLTMLAAVLALDAVCSIPFAYLRYQKRPFRFAGLKLFNIFLNIFLNIFFLIVCPWLMQHAPATVSWFYISGYGVGYIFVSNVITSLFTFFLLLPDMKPCMGRSLDLSLLKRMYRYSLPILILGLAGILNQSVDKILFPFLFDDRDYANEQLGIYSACFKIAVVMVMFIQAFRYAYEPFIFAKNKSEDNRKAYSEAMKYFIIFALLIFLCVMFYLDIIKYIVVPEYYPGLKVVPIVMLGEFFFGIYFNLSLWYKLTDQTQWGAYFSILGCIITVSIILVFVPIYGFMACAWASFVCNLVMMLLSYFIGQKKYPVRYDLKSAAIYGLVAVAVYAAGMWPDIDSETLRLAYRTVLLGLFVLLIIKRDLPLKEIPFLNRFIK
ncbi:MAG: oligosaccharide flippase family protein [Massilibacteroides sp.]|nr:oligosaccharide flippase family protein [Massilibacteroides sp.]MDD3062133.1 oligosaccharide flippase family protein [Massilibacteroides sp.]MDD4114709.1 oligosaccharide flippase family protein [Massilibacteroides sp.]MDD4660306.1 oligosaccharide flippase family protein [Massilibacteroides sp.]